MTKASTSPVAYYIAGGEKIELIPADDLFAVDASDAINFGGFESVGRGLGGGLRLVTKGELGAAANILSGMKPKYPVFRSRGSIIVALPEVRVEESRMEHRVRLDDWLTKHQRDVTVVSREDERLVLTPASGSGLDALTIATDLFDEVDPEMAQTRFVRVVPRTK